MGGRDVTSVLAAAGRQGLRRALDGAAATEPMPATLKTEAPGAHAVMVHVSDVERKSVRWLWPHRIPLGKLTVLDGDPARGKSVLTLDLAARVTAHHPMPDGTHSDLDGPAGVVLLSAEDDIADTIRPRLEAAGAMLERVVCVQAVEDARTGKRSATLADIRPLAEAIEKAGAALVVIDPLAAYLGGRADAYRDADMRGLLAPLADLAARTGVAIVVVRHLRKSASTSALYAGGGSIGIIGAARVGLLAAAAPDDPTGERRLLAVTKCNVGPVAPTLAYRIFATSNVPRVEWLGPVAWSADALVSQPPHGADQLASALDEATEFLRQELAVGPRLSIEIQSAAKRESISAATLRRARERMGVLVRKDGAQGAWTWRLPTEARALDA